MSQFTSEQRNVIAALLQEERASAIHDMLVYLEPYRLTIKGLEVAFEPYGTEAHYDFVCRRAGDAWPEHPFEDQYKTPDEPVPS